MPSFSQTLRPTPFGFYDSDPLFQKDADAMVTFVLRRLGEDILGVELTKKMIWMAFEEATRKLNSLFIEYQAKSNLASLLGSPTGSLDQNGNNIINLSNVYVQQNLQFLSDLAAPYSALIGYGNFAENYSGSIVLENGRQDYDLYTELKDDTGTPLFNLQPSGSISKMQVYEVFHFAPVQYVFNSNIASNFIASGLPVESYIPDTRFYVLPLFEDVLRAGMLKGAQKVRRSHYSYKITGRNLRIYPTPTNIVPGINDRLWVRVGFRQKPYGNLTNDLLTSGSSIGPSFVSSGSAGLQQNQYIDQSLFGVNSPFSAPYGPWPYKSLNIWARTWIAEMTLAISTEMLGRIRSKFKNFPIPGAELTLNGDDLVAAGREEQEKLITSMRETLENLSYDKLAEREAAKAENVVKQLSFIPMPPNVAIRIY
jgi:hypothetical protein